MLTLVAAILFAAAVLATAEALERVDGKCITYSRSLQSPSPPPKDLALCVRVQNANTAGAERYSSAEIAEIMDWLDESAE